MKARHLVRLRRVLVPVLLASVWLAILAVPGSIVRAQQGTTITVNPSTTYQTMRGWEVTPSGMFLPTFSSFRNNLIAKGVDLGLNRFRLEVRAGSENPTDYYAQWKAAGYPGAAGDGGPGDIWRAHRYETINDNSNSSVINPSGFHWTELDDMVGWFVTPMRAKLAAQGEPLWVNLCYVAFTLQNTSGLPYIHTDPNEYAEYMLAVFQHLQGTYGWVPDSIEMVLEPDNVPQWNGTLLGQALVAAGNRLAANGFHPEFIAPSTTGVANGVQMIDQMLAVPGVLTYLKELSYHRYAQTEATNIAAYATRATSHNLATSMLEWWTDGNTPATLYEDLTLGRVSAWQPKTLSGLFTIDTTGAVTTTLNTAYFRQYMHYVRRGAVRVGATSNGSATPLAFINPGNHYVVVVSTTGAQALTVTNLPPGTYGVHYTTASQIDQDAGTQTVGSSGALTTSIPAAGYLTVFNTQTSAPTPPAAFGKSTPTFGASNQPTSTTLTWAASSGASSYSYCIDATNNGQCDSSWVSAGSNTSATVNNLTANTAYYWQVQATNATGTTPADGSTTAFWSFTTAPLPPPAAFAKSTPGTGTTGLSTAPTLTWTSSPGATSYQYCFDTTNDGACSNWISTGTSTSVTLSGLAQGVNYFWQVRAINSGGTTYADNLVSAFWQFTTQAALPAPGSFVKVSPILSAVGQPLSLVLVWDTSIGATSYQYCYDTTNDGTCSAWTNAGLVAAVAIGGLVPNTTYYWQVRAINSAGTTYADGSAAAFASFTTLIGQPGAFGKISPAAGATGQATSVLLSWGPSAGATGYEYCFDTTNDGACWSWISAGTNTSAAISGLAPGTTYYWQVRATNGSGIATYADGDGGTRSFTTQVASPGVFGKISPAAGATGQSTSLSLTWTASANATGYQYCFDTTNDGACASWTSAGSGTNASITGLAPGTTYYWQVRASNAAGTTYADGSASTFRGFTTQVAAPGAFGKVSPAQAATGQATSLILNWTASANAASYDYCIDTTNDETCAGWSSVGSSTSASVTGLASNTTYYWQVRASNASGLTYADGAATAFRSFTTQVAAPGAFGKVSPAAGATGLATTLTLAWTASTAATTYEYCFDTTNDGTCSAWTGAGSNTSAAIGGLFNNTTYYWQVRATNVSGTTYADGGVSSFRSFATKMASPAAFAKNAAAVSVTTATLSWAASAGAASYEYCLDTTNDDGCANWISTGTGTSIGIGGLTAGTTYYWQVRALNAGGMTYADGGAGAFQTFTTQGSGPGSFKKTAPAADATGLALNLTLSWASSAGAAGYEYCYDTTDDGACSNWTSSGTQTSAAISGLSAGTSYYWQVRASNEAGTTYADGDITAFRKLTTQAIQKAELISPAPGSTLTAATVTFQWTGGVGIAQYALQIGTVTGASDLANSGFATNLSAVVSGLPTNGRTLYVRLLSMDVNGAMQYNDYLLTASSVRSQKAQLTSPAPGSTLTASVVTFQWTGGVGVSHYFMHLGTVAGASDLLNRDLGTSLSTVVNSLPTDGRTIYVRLWSLIDATWQYNDYTLTAVAPLAQKAGLTSPAPGSTLTATTVTFQWTGGTAVDQYWLYVGTAAGAADFFSGDMGTSLSTVVGSLPADGRKLYVRLFSHIQGAWDYNDYVLTAVSLAPAPAAAELTSPAGGSTLTSSTVTFTWTGGTATQYWLYVGNSPGSSDIMNRDMGTSLSLVVSDLPTDGRTIYVRLFSYANGIWMHNDYMLTTATIVTSQKAELVSPAPASTLTSSAVTFQWTGGLGVSQYWLYIGTAAGASNLLSRDMGTSLSTTATALPTDGSTIYVRLFSLIGGSWQYNDYTLRAVTLATTQQAQLISPAPGSTLTSTTVTFEWTGGAGAIRYWLYVGSSPGATDLASRDLGAALSTVVSGLPADGRQIYVRLYSLVNGAWLFTDYTFTAKNP